jgi:histone H3/H4
MAQTKQMARTLSGRMSSRKRTSTKAGCREGDTRKVIKQRRQRPGSLALRDIRRYQKTTEQLILRVAFERLACKILENLTGERDAFHFQPLAVAALQEASEAHLVNVLCDSNLCCIHAVC